VEAHVTRLHELRLALMEQHAEVLLDLGSVDDAVVALQELVVEHPLREKPHVLLMTALYRAGRQAEALEVYERARRTLATELGIDPGPGLRTTVEAVLRQDARLDPITTENGVDPRFSLPVPSRPTESWRPLDELIGRAQEVARLRELMGVRRLVTLTGPGGAGKSRLAAHLAAEVTSDDVWWVDLAQASGTDTVMTAVGTATGVSGTPGNDVQGLVGSLSGRQGLMVLDTCERVRAIVKDFAESLLRDCPGLRLLATSRQPIGAATELVWPVPPLSLPHPEATAASEVADSSAVQLFLERATSRQPDFALTDGNAADVARICLLLDGLPLAIELAAAHASTLVPARMVQVLDDRLRILVDEGRGERQSTLRTTIGWSYEQLSEEEARFFERLSVFAGPFPFEGAVAVAGAGLSQDGLTLLLGLARQSLVVVSEDRYRLLDTIRAFAFEKLDASPGERSAAQRRHAAWYVGLLDEEAPALSGHTVRGWRGELRGALLDLRSALAWCFSSGEVLLGAQLLGALWWLWPREGVFEEATQWFETAERAVDQRSALHAALLSSAATYAVTKGDFGSAISRGRAAATDLERCGDLLGAARALLPVGIALWGRGDYTEAAAAHDAAIERFERSRDEWGVALARVLRARTALDAASADAPEHLAAAETAARRLGDRHLLATALLQRAKAAMGRNAFDEAASLADESVALNDAHGHREGAAGALHVLGYARVGQDDPSSASTCFRRALQWALAMHHLGAIAESLDGMAVVASCEKRWADAARLLARADSIRAANRIRESSSASALLEGTRRRVHSAMTEQELQEAERQAAWMDLRGLVTPG
jgi:predicted ATPase